ncbi:hypothetical protein ANCDUO_02769, partial [Ancylostoma duodenale]
MADMGPEGIWGTGVFSAFELKTLTKPSIVTCSSLTNGRPVMQSTLRKNDPTSWISALSSNNSPLDGSLPSSPPPSAMAAIKALAESECHIPGTTSGTLRTSNSIPQEEPNEKRSRHASRDSATSSTNEEVRRIVERAAESGWNGGLAGEELASGDAARRNEFIEKGQRIVLQRDGNRYVKIVQAGNTRSAAPATSSNVRRVTLASVGGDEQQLGVVVVDSRSATRGTGGFQQPERNGVPSNAYTSQPQTLAAALSGLSPLGRGDLMSTAVYQSRAPM